MDLNKIIFLMMLCVPMFVGAQTLTFTGHEPMGNMRTQVTRQFFRLVEQESTVPIGIAYAIWSALGIVLITLIGIFVFKQVPDIPAYIGLALIMAGVIVINLFSKMEVH